MQRYVFSAVAVSFTFGVAAIALESPPGEVQSSFESSRRISETCSLPRILDVVGTQTTAAYVPFLEAEKKTAEKICRADFYDSRESTAGATAVVTCPKLNSTNPGLMIHELPNGTTREAFLRDECVKPKKRSGDLIAKFKQSTSCSYTPAILSYPRMARILKSQAELPFTAYRSMARPEHEQQGKAALGYIQCIADAAKTERERQAVLSSLIAQTWRGLYAMVKDSTTKGTPEKRAALFTDLYTVRANDPIYPELAEKTKTYNLIYGALVPDLSGDEIYWEANGSARGDRVANFQVTDAFRMVSNPRPLASWGGARNHDAATIQKVTLLREMGDLIVLDTLLNQQDRFGNLHYRPHYVRVNADGGIEWKKAKAKLKEVNGKDELVWDAAEGAAMTAQGFVPVKRMLMNDNDCGVAKQNKMGAAGIAKKVTHLHPDTYLGVRRMAALVRDVRNAQGVVTGLAGPLVDYLKSDLLFTDKDVKSVVANLRGMAKDFQKRCADGSLHLDADVAQWLGKTAAIDSRDFCTKN